MNPWGALLKFNFDGAPKENLGVSGIDGVSRNCAGHVLGYFAKGVGFLWAYEAKMQAILHTLLFFHQFNFQNVIINWTLNSANRHWKLMQEFNHIDYLMPLVNCVGVVHVSIWGNEFADYLANQGCGCHLGSVWIFVISLWEGSPILSLFSINSTLAKKLNEPLRMLFYFYYKL